MQVIYKNFVFCVFLSKQDPSSTTRHETRTEADSFHRRIRCSPLSPPDLPAPRSRLPPRCARAHARAQLPCFPRSRSPFPRCTAATTPSHPVLARQIAPPPRRRRHPVPFPAARQNGAPTLQRAKSAPSPLQPAKSTLPPSISFAARPSAPKSCLIRFPHHHLLHAGLDLEEPVARVLPHMETKLQIHGKRPHFIASSCWAWHNMSVCDLPLFPLY